MKKISEVKKELVSSALNNIAEAKLGLKRVRANASAAAKIYLAMKRVLEKKSMYMNVWAGASGAIYLSCATSVESFKDDPLLLELLELAIDKMGGSAKMSTEDYPDHGSREYRFVAGDIHLTIDARLKGEGSENCRREVIGSEMVEVKKYRFVCDGVPS